MRATELIDALNDKKAEIRWRAAEALAKIKADDPNVIPSLRNLLEDKSDLVVTIALDSLDKLGAS